MDQNENQPVIEKCPFCSEKIAPGMTKCTHCGEEFGAHSIKPGLSKEVAQIIPDLQPALHFAVLSAATLGLYEIYWFYRNWRQLGAYKELDILPGWRTAGLFIPIYGQYLAYDLFRNIRDLAKALGVDKSYSPGLILFGWLTLIALWFLPHPLWFFGLLSVWPLVAVHKVLNSYWQKTQPGLAEKLEFAREEKFLLLLGGILLFFVFSKVFVPE